MNNKEQLNYEKKTYFATVVGIIVMVLTLALGVYSVLKPGELKQETAPTFHIEQTGNGNIIINNNE